MIYCHCTRMNCFIIYEVVQANVGEVDAGVISGLLWLLVSFHGVTDENP